MFRRIWGFSLNLRCTSALLPLHFSLNTAVVRPVLRTYDLYSTRTAGKIGDQYSIYVVPYIVLITQQERYEVEHNSKRMYTHLIIMGSSILLHWRFVAFRVM
jgi:hypothetical protein